MIARIWNGKTAAVDYDAYSQFLIDRAVPDYQQTPGFLSLSFLRRVVGNEAHFQLLTYWQDMESIKRFAGEEAELAKYYPEDERFLLHFDEKVQHFDVFAVEVPGVQ